MRTAAGSHDHLAVVDVIGDRLVARDPLPTPAWPRHHAVVDGRVLVAGQLDHRVTVHAAPGRAADGAEPAPVDELSIGSPACVLVRP